MSLQFKKCKTCGRIFDGYGMECPACIEENERQFNIVKEYVWEHPRTSVQELLRETEVDEKRVARFLKEGRLELDNSEGLVTCERCGVPISHGTLCRKCKEKLAAAMDRVLPKQEPAKREESAVKTSGKDKLHVRVDGR